MDSVKFRTGGNKDCKDKKSYVITIYLYFFKLIRLIQQRIATERMNGDGDIGIRLKQGLHRYILGLILNAAKNVV